MCECGHESCRETVFLTLDAFEVLHDSGETVLERRARGEPGRLRTSSPQRNQAPRAQAEHQATRAKKNLGLR